VLTINSSNTNGASMTYTDDALNRLASAKDNRVAAQGGPSTPTTYRYDPVGNLSGYAYPNTVQTANAFDTLNRPNLSSDQCRGHLRPVPDERPPDQATFATQPPLVSTSHAYTKGSLGCDSPCHHVRRAVQDQVWR
jgi:hypothetical protein